MRYAFRLFLVLLTAAACNAASAQHADVLLLSDGSRIVTGSANFDQIQWSAGTRVFARDFDSDYEIDNPGFNALSAASPFMPTGYTALPASSDVSWDFLPMTVPPTVSNLLYWNGLDTNADGVDLLDVEFDTPLNYTLAIEGVGGTAAANGSNQIVAGPALVRSDSEGSIHYHADFLLDDGDVATDPADGIYLVALRVEMATLDASDPFFLVFGTPGSTLEARNAAVAWVTERVDTLVVEPLLGDYNGNGVVDAADYTVWRDTLDSMTNLAADGDGSLQIGTGDYEVWRANFGDTAGSQMSAASSTRIPEPSTIAMMLLAAIAASHAVRRLPLAA